MKKDKKQLLLPCLRGAMGDWIYYVALMKFEDIAERVKLAEEIHKHSGLRDLLQRTLTDRSSSIGQYLCNQKQHFFNSIIAGIYLGEPAWYDIAVGGNELIDIEDLPTIAKESIGILSLTGAEAVFAIDGQHRVEGIRHALKERPQLGQEEQSIIFVAHDNSKKGLQRTRRLFSTLNRYAKPVSLSEIIAIDEDDIVAIITRQLLESHKLLSKPEIISVTKSKTIHRTNKKCLTSIHSLYEITDIILFSENDIRKKIKHELKTTRPEEKTISKYYERAEKFWDEVAKTFKQVEELIEEPVDKKIAGKYRNTNGGHLLFRPVGIASIAMAIRKLLDNGYELERIMPWLAKIEMDLNKPPWRGLLWEPGKKRMITLKKNRDIATNIIIYCSGINLVPFKFDKDSLTKDYASALNKEEGEIRLPDKISI